LLMGAEEAPPTEEEREEMMEIHPPIPDDDEEEGFIRWERVDPEEHVYPEPQDAAENALEHLAEEINDNPATRQEALVLINQYLHLRIQDPMEENQMPLIVDEGRIVANPRFNLDNFRM
ncbi:hypothetical protein PMAYCL1PPCAC_33274, partial [Pristionchus mayeri]